MACARLRISVFPTIGDGPDAHEWTEPARPRHEASYCWDLIYALSDGETPSRSDDKSVPRLTWAGHKGTTEWLTYRFDRARTVSWCEVYWYADTSQSYYRVPASWKVLYREGDVWREVANPSDYGTTLDRFNRVTFDPVETVELKMEVKLQPKYSGGVLEWKTGD